VSSRIGQYIPGTCARPSEEAIGEYGSHAPKAMIDRVVIVSDQLARLSKKSFRVVIGKTSHLAANGGGLPASRPDECRAFGENSGASRPRIYGR